MLKNVKLLIALMLTVGVFFACGDDDDTQMMDDPQYSVMIMQPNTEDKHVNDSIHVHVEFASATNQTVHHVKVKIYNKVDETNIIFDAPAEAHVHAENGSYAVHAAVGLTNDAGVEAHSDWIMEAKVWGHEAGASEVIEQIEFNVHPE